MSDDYPPAGDCPFCARIANGEYDDEYDGIVHFEPLNPVVPGHLLVVPKAHVINALENPHIAGSAMAYAANLANGSCNIITSVDSVATQTVFHLHIHIVPRHEGDGLALPWTGQVKARQA